MFILQIDLTLKVALVAENLSLQPLSSQMKDNLCECIHLIKTIVVCRKGLTELCSDCIYTPMHISLYYHFLLLFTICCKPGSNEIKL